MFGKKKPISNSSSKTLFNVGIITINDLDDEQYDEWTYELMGAAENVGTTTSLVQAAWDDKQLKILQNRFPQVDMNETIFMINEIINEDIKMEIKRLEQKHKWKKFFNTIPLTDYIDAEDRVVMDASKTLFCTNNVEEATEFLEEKAGRADS